MTAGTVFLSAVVGVAGGAGLFWFDGAEVRRIHRVHLRCDNPLHRAEASQVSAIRRLHSAAVSLVFGCVAAVLAYGILAGWWTTVGGAAAAVTVGVGVTVVAWLAVGWWALRRVQARGLNLASCDRGGAS